MASETLHIRCHVGGNSGCGANSVTLVAFVFTRLHRYAHTWYIYIHVHGAAFALQKRDENDNDSQVNMEQRETEPEETRRGVEASYDFVSYVTRLQRVLSGCGDVLGGFWRLGVGRKCTWRLEP